MNLCATKIVLFLRQTKYMTFAMIEDTNPIENENKKVKSI